MAHSPRTLGYVCRSCRRALGTNAVRIHHPRDAARSFSSSQSLLKTLATFTPTSSPELDTLLNSWRKEIFLPSILSPHHRDLVYKTSRKEILTTPPGVSVSVQPALPPSAPNASSAEEETIKLEPMNLFDRPNLNKSYQNITRLLEENTDAKTWDNLIPFLEGLRHARIETYPHFLPRLARIASTREAARWTTILAAATMSKRTGVTLAHQDLTWELVMGTFHRAVEGGFAHPEPVRTLLRIVLLLDTPEHCGGKIPTSTNKITYADMRHDVSVLAVQSAFAAASVLREQSGKDTDGTATKAIQRLLVLEKATPGRLLASVNEYTADTGRETPFAKQNTILTRLMPLYAAFSLTNKVNMQSYLGKEKSVQTHVEVQRILKDIRSTIDAARSGLNEAKNSQGEKGNEQTRGLFLLNGIEGFLKDR